MGNSKSKRKERKSLRGVPESSRVPTVNCSITLPGQSPQNKDVKITTTGKDLKTDWIQRNNLNSQDYVVVLSLPGDEKYILNDDEELGDMLDKVDNIEIMDRMTAENQQAQWEELNSSIKEKKKA